jgi:hypothetical protein
MKMRKFRHKEYEPELYEDFEEFLRLVSDDDLLMCVHDDRVMLPLLWISKEDWKDFGNSYEEFNSREQGSFRSKQRIKREAIEAELNRRGIKWRQYSDEERDCLWFLQHLIYPTTAVTREDVEEFRRLVKANGGKVPHLRFSPSENTKLQLDQIGLIAERTRDHKGVNWSKLKDLRMALRVMDDDR